ncbi:MAG: TauD/TfdA family dioxygenase [Alphaproteobacteria bacterium]
MNLSGRRREPATALQPVVDPAGWTPAEFRPVEPWVFRLDGAAIADVLAATGRVEQAGTALVDIKREDFDLPVAEAALARILDELVHGCGFVQVRGMPVNQMTRCQAAIAFLGMSTHLGGRLSQNAAGHVLGHVKDLGFDYDDPRARGYQTAAALGFHTDPCDFVALMCLRTAQSGGESRIVSSVHLYNEMLRRRPDLVAELTEDLYWTRHGEIAPGEEPYYRMPVFSFVDGYFSGRGISTHIMKAQRLPGVPAFTAKQKEAIDMFRALTQELAVDVPFEQGDFQILSNHVMLHSRRPFVDRDSFEEKRHLLRLWIDHPGSRPVPDLVRENFRGIEVAGFSPKAPLEADAEAA